MRVLAIGGTGFIGRNVVRLLIEQGHDVTVLHRNGSTALPVGARELLGDRALLRELRPALDRFEPDVVLDLILYTKRQAQATVDAFRGKAARVVAVSSADVYRNYDGWRGKPTAPPDGVPLKENAPLRESRYPYRGHRVNFEHADEYEKIDVEEVVMNEPELPAVVLRLPAVYGPGDAQHRLRAYVQRMTDLRPAILLDERQISWRWTRGYVENVAAAIALTVSNGRSAGHIYNVGEDPPATERKWVERIGAAMEWSGALVPVPAADLPDHLRQECDWRYELWSDTARIRHDLGYVEPVPIETALKRAIDWERSALEGIDLSQYAAEDAVLKSRMLG